MIGSLNFRVGYLDLIRLSDSTKLDPSASKTATIATIAMLESSVGSSSEVNSPVSFATTESTGEKIKEFDKTMDNLDLGDQLKEFMIDTSNKSMDTWKIGLVLHEDNQTTPSQVAVASLTTSIKYS
jgi:hypothetical protein